MTLPAPVPDDKRRKIVAWFTKKEGRAPTDAEVASIHANPKTWKYTEEDEGAPSPVESFKLDLSSFVTRDYGPRVSDHLMTSISRRLTDIGALLPEDQERAIQDLFALVTRPNGYLAGAEQTVRTERRSEAIAFMRLSYVTPLITSPDLDDMITATNADEVLLDKWADEYMSIYQSYIDNPGQPPPSSLLEDFLDQKARVLLPTVRPEKGPWDPKMVSTSYILQSAVSQVIFAVQQKNYATTEFDNYRDMLRNQMDKAISANEPSETAKYLSSLRWTVLSDPALLQRFLSINRDQMVISAEDYLDGQLWPLVKKAVAGTDMDNPAATQPIHLVPLLSTIQAAPKLREEAKKRDEFVFDVIQKMAGLSDTERLALGAVDIAGLLRQSGDNVAIAMSIFDSMKARAELAAEQEGEALKASFKGFEKADKSSLDLSETEAKAAIAQAERDDLAEIVRLKGEAVTGAETEHQAFLDSLGGDKDAAETESQRILDEARAKVDGMATDWDTMLDDAEAQGDALEDEAAELLSQAQAAASRAVTRDQKETAAGLKVEARAALSEAKKQASRLVRQAKRDVAAAKANAKREQAAITAQAKKQAAAVKAKAAEAEKKAKADAANVLKAEKDRLDRAAADAKAKAETQAAADTLKLAQERARLDKEAADQRAKQLKDIQDAAAKAAAEIARQQEDFLKKQFQQGPQPPAVPGAGGTAPGGGTGTPPPTGTGAPEKPPVSPPPVPPKPVVDASSPPQPPPQPVPPAPLYQASVEMEKFIADLLAGRESGDKTFAFNPQEQVVPPKPPAQGTTAAATPVPTPAADPWAGIQLPPGVGGQGGLPLAQPIAAKAPTPQPVLTGPQLRQQQRQREEEEEES